MQLHLSMCGSCMKVDTCMCVHCTVHVCVCFCIHVGAVGAHMGVHVSVGLGIRV